MKAQLSSLKLIINPKVLKTLNIPILVIYIVNLLTLKVVESYLLKIFRSKLTLLIVQLVQLLILHKMVIKYIIYTLKPVTPFPSL